MRVSLAVLAALAVFTAYAAGADGDDGATMGGGEDGNPSAEWLEEAAKEEYHNKLDKSYADRLGLLTGVGTRDVDFEENMHVTLSKSEQSGVMTQETVDDSWQVIDVFGAAVIDRAFTKKITSKLLSGAKSRFDKLFRLAHSKDDTREALEDGPGFQELRKIETGRYSVMDFAPLREVVEETDVPFKPLLGALFGGELTLMRADVQVTLPGAEYIPWHTEAFDLFPDTPNYLTPTVIVHVYVPLQDVSVVNGGLHVRPGSHVAIESKAPGVTLNAVAGSAILVDWRVERQELDLVTEEPTYYAVLTYSRIWMRPFEFPGESLLK